MIFNLKMINKFSITLNSSKIINVHVSNLQYKIIKEGQGEKPIADSRVVVHYRGVLIDGTEFDSSYARGEPIELSLNQVIQGWQEALQLMNPGSKWKLYVPPTLGYGESAAGPLIQPNSTLIFEIELLSIEDAKKNS